MAEEKKTILSTSTLIPIGAIAAVIAVTMWLAGLYYTANAALTLAQKSDSRLTKIETSIAQIDTKLDDFFPGKVSFK